MTWKSRCLDNYGQRVYNGFDGKNIRISSENNKGQCLNVFVVNKNDYFVY